ncbi:hypothetical protein FQR65_LT18289 [Abscondita terminalis]|nr:hypothetical protein FQR65_LT18289 [Abscondita terminalis]
MGTAAVFLYKGLGSLLAQPNSAVPRLFPDSAALGGGSEGTRRAGLRGSGRRAWQSVFGGARVGPAGFAAQVKDRTCRSMTRHWCIGVSCGPGNRACGRSRAGTRAGRKPDQNLNCETRARAAAEITGFEQVDRPRSWAPCAGDATGGHEGRLTEYDDHAPPTRWYLSASADGPRAGHAGCVILVEPALAGVAVRP